MIVPPFRFSLSAVFAALLLVFACAPPIDFQPHSERYAKCAARSSVAPVGHGRVKLVGAIHQIDDETQVDGAVRLLLIDPDGHPRKLFFGSLFTRPAPSEQRKATYRAIALSRTGDCVEAHGTTMPDGQLEVEHFLRLD